MVTEPRKGQLVLDPCKFCRRQPRIGERYGTGAADWDFTGICPECWDETTAEDED
jgi:hypothetical protein